jgi:hypothetical protein
VASEDSILVEFELASPIDVEGVKVPGRVVIGRYCVWRYQGGPLNNEGGCNWPLNGNGRFFNEKDELITRNITSISTCLVAVLMLQMLKLKLLEADMFKYGKQQEPYPLTEILLNILLTGKD